VKSHPRVLFDTALLDAIRDRAEGAEELSRLVVWERAFRHYPLEEMLRLEKLPERARRLAFLHALRGTRAERALELARMMLRSVPVTFRGTVAWVESLAQVYDWCFEELGNLGEEIGAKVREWSVKVEPASPAEDASAAPALLAAGAALESGVGGKLFERGRSAAQRALADIAGVPPEGLESLARAERVAHVFCGGSLGVREHAEGPGLSPALSWLLGRPPLEGRGPGGVYAIVFAVRT